MKKLILGILLAILSINIVFAGTTGPFTWNVDADTLNGVNYSQIHEEINNNVAQLQRTDAEMVGYVQRSVAIEEAERKVQDNGLKEDIRNEVINRQTADNNLQTYIDNNVAQLQQTDAEMVGYVQRSVDIEKAERIVQDNGLKEDIRTETYNRINADNNLQTYIDNNVAQLQRTDAEMVGYVQRSVAIEEAERKVQDNGLKEDIRTETDNRINADHDLQNNIDSENSERILEDGILQSNINNEAMIRQNEDSNLQRYIKAVDQKEDASGITTSDLKKLLTGSKKSNLFSKDYKTYDLYLTQFFAGKDDVKLALDNIALEFDKINTILYLGTDNPLDVAMVTSARTGQTIDVGNYKCNSNMKDCVAITSSKNVKEIIEPKKSNKELLGEPVETHEEYLERACNRLKLKWACNELNVVN